MQGVLFQEEAVLESVHGEVCVCLGTLPFSSVCTLVPPSSSCDEDVSLMLKGLDSGWLPDKCSGILLFGNALGFCCQLGTRQCQAHIWHIWHSRLVPVHTPISHLRSPLASAHHQQYSLYFPWYTKSSACEIHLCTG